MNFALGQRVRLTPEAQRQRRDPEHRYTLLQPASVHRITRCPRTGVSYDLRYANGLIVERLRGKDLQPEHTPCPSDPPAP